MSRELFPVAPREAAEMMVDPHDPNRRREGALLIGNSLAGGAEANVNYYRDRVRAGEDDPGARAAFIRALAKWGSADDAIIIAPHLADRDNMQVRWEAARGLQRLHHPQVVPKLLETLGDATEVGDVRTEVAYALGQYPEDRVFQKLLEALDARELAVNLAVMESLKTLTGQDFGLDPGPWFRWYRDAPERFASADSYRYPTFQRGETFFEKLAFWGKKQWEQPGIPAGLEPAGTRSTYGGAEETATP